MEVFLILLAGIGVLFYGLNYQPKKEPEPEPEQPAPPPTPKPPFAVSKHTGMRLPHRNRHHLVIAPTGHGKSEFLKHLLLDDFENYRAGKCSIVIFDTKGDLIDDLLGAHEVCDAMPIVIDPRDIEHPFNLGFVDFAALQSRNPTKQLIAYNSALQLISTMLGSMDAEMTSKQNTLFMQLFKLLAKVPNANLETINDILRKGSQKEFQEYIDQLDKTDRDWFADLYYGSKEMNETKDQVRRRIGDILANPILRQSVNTSSTFDFRAALDSGSIILVNVSTKILRDSAPTYGRLILAKILQAIEDREGRERSKMVHLYADEAYVYLDESAEDILHRGRSANVGFVVSLPDLTKITPTLADILIANTYTKTVGAVTMNAGRKIMAGTAFPKWEVSDLVQLRSGEYMTFSRSHICYEIARPMHIHNNQWTQPSLHMYQYFKSTDVIGKFANVTTKSLPGERARVMENTRKLYTVTNFSEPVMNTGDTFQTVRQKKEEEDDVSKAKPWRS